MARVDLVVRGRVQGVGFRFFVARRAEEHGVRGTVRNRPDRSVEVQAEGEGAALTAFVADVRRGPAQARVEDVIEQWGDGPVRFRSFEIL